MPVIDLSPGVGRRRSTVAAMRAALVEGDGALRVRCREAEVLCGEALEAMDVFFGGSAEAKEACASASGAARGYERHEAQNTERFRVGPDASASASDGLGGREDVDAREAYAENVWPEDGRVRAALESAYDAVGALAAAALDALADACRLPKAAFACRRPTHMLAVNRYHGSPRPRVVVPSHTDVGLVTLVYATPRPDAPGGLEIRRRDGRFARAADDVGFVLTVGAAAAAWVHSGLTATSHRVVGGPTARTSLVFFAGPEPTTTLGAGGPVYKAWRRAWLAAKGPPTSATDMLRALPDVDVDIDDDSDIDDDVRESSRAPRFVVVDGRLVSGDG